MIEGIHCIRSLEQATYDCVVVSAYQETSTVVINHSARVVINQNVVVSCLCHEICVFSGVVCVAVAWNMFHCVIIICATKQCIPFDVFKNM